MWISVPVQSLLCLCHIVNRTWVQQQDGSIGEVTNQFGTSHGPMKVTLWIGRRSVSNRAQTSCSNYKRSRREVIVKSLTTFKLKPNENSANIMHFYRWEFGESLQRMCDWGFNELLTPFYAVQCRAMNTALVFYDLFGQGFANLYAFQYHGHKKMSPVLIHVSTRELTFHHTGVLRSYVIRSFKRLYLH